MTNREEHVEWGGGGGSGGAQPIMLRHRVWWSFESFFTKVVSVNTVQLKSWRCSLLPEGDTRPLMFLALSLPVGLLQDDTASVSRPILVNYAVLSPTINQINHWINILFYVCSHRGDIKQLSPTDKIPSPRCQPCEHRADANNRLSYSRLSRFRF